MFASGSKAIAPVASVLDAVVAGPLYGTYGPYTSCVLAAGTAAEGFAAGVAGAVAASSTVIGAESGRATPLRSSVADEFCASPAVAASIHTAAQTIPVALKAVPGITPSSRLANLIASPPHSNGCKARRPSLKTFVPQSVR
jgi:energy-converting hydrogenase Eha subunit B